MPDERKKQWTTEEASNLIEAYREHSNLWNPKNTDYKNRIKKMDSLKEIAVLFGTNSTEIDRKLKNIITQYQRERRNYKKMKTSGAGQFFKAKWFGYNAMAFLHDKNKPRKGVQAGGDYEEEDSSAEESDDVELETESNTEDPDTDQTVIDDDNNPSSGKESVEKKKNKMLQAAEIPGTSKNEDNSQPLFAIPKIAQQRKTLKRGNDKSDSSQIFEIMKSVYEKRGETAKRDEYDVFGEMVAHNLRNLKSEYSKVTVQQRITSLLYEARITCNFPQHSMQYFTTPLPSPSPPSPLACTSSASSFHSDLESQQQYESFNATSYQDDTQNTNILETALTSALNDNN